MGSDVPCKYDICRHMPYGIAHTNKAFPRNLRISILLKLNVCL